MKVPLIGEAHAMLETSSNLDPLFFRRQLRLLGDLPFFVIPPNKKAPLVAEAHAMTLTSSNLGPPLIGRQLRLFRDLSILVSSPQVQTSRGAPTTTHGEQQ
mmetsp:Transcript_123908/g.246661  ORF Transcript_123908/g.246661 Transcript_123908/m.246661 type:complete len:101 (-) Transcript_123908:72-374(-)